MDLGGWSPLVADLAHTLDTSPPSMSPRWCGFSEEVTAGSRSSFLPHGLATGSSVGSRMG
jgi:hypothetical protein